MPGTSDTQHDVFPAGLGQSVLSRKQALKAGALTAAGLAGASAVGTARPVRAAATPQEVTITLWSFDPTLVRLFSEEANDWKAAYPQYDFTFQFTQVPYTLGFDKSLAAFA